MNSNRWRLIDDLCNAALACTESERSAFLVKACSGDDALRREVESLLEHEPHAERFMSAPAVALAKPSVLSAADCKIGRAHV